MATSSASSSPASRHAQREVLAERAGLERRSPAPRGGPSWRSRRARRSPPRPQPAALGHRAGIGAHGDGHRQDGEQRVGAAAKTTVTGSSRPERASPSSARSARARRAAACAAARRARAARPSRRRRSSGESTSQARAGGLASIYGCAAVSDWFEHFGYAEVADDLLIGAYPQDADDVAALAMPA